MKPTLSWLGSLSNKGGFDQCINMKKRQKSDATVSEQKTGSTLCQCQTPDTNWNNLK